MRIETELKYDFDDVLIRPKRSTLTSRKEVDLTRTFRFKYGGSYHGIPVMAANMDGVGTLEVGRTLSDLDLFTCYKKDIDEKELIEDLKDNQGKHVAVTVGRNELDYERLARINKKAPVRNICIDVANGYTQALVDFVKVVRRTFPQRTIIAGNVVTGEMVEEQITETETMAPGPMAQSDNPISYDQLRARLPAEITDDIVELMANSAEALEDFAMISSQQDVDLFNQKYSVNLVLPSGA